MNTSAENPISSPQQQTDDHQIANNDARARTGQNDQQQNQKPPYTIPGILHYLQYEWHKFEVERQEWEVEKAELSARIALLQGEKKSHENLRHDLIRRIKMLEYCLRMERAKYNKLKHKTDPPSADGLSFGDQQQNTQDSNDIANDDQQQKTAQQQQTQDQQLDDGFLNNNSSTITYGRELLKHYLQEIGYTDTLIDLRLNLARSQPQPQKNDVVDIGELVTLTTLDSDTNGEDFRKKQWTNKYRLQSHLDCVRDLKFIERDSLIVTASEDETIKLWHLTNPSSTSGNSCQPNLPPSMNASIIDIEPLQTYRGHEARVLCLTIHNDNIFSGAQNGEIIMWKIIQVTNKTDLYAKFDDSLLICKFDAHDDAIWSIDVIENSQKSGFVLCSASSDMTLKIWNLSPPNGCPDMKTPLKTIELDSPPTCITRMPPYNTSITNVDLAVAACDGKVRLFHISACLSETNNETGNTQPVTILEDGEPHRINSIVIHPTLPYLASADSNKSVKFWDLKANECKSTMVAHIDEVTSLACDPTGKYLLSASHDCSARLWLFEERQCIQEITSHRKKFDEGIFAVAFHPNLSQFATAGADGLAKVFM